MGAVVGVIVEMTGGVAVGVVVGVATGAVVGMAVRALVGVAVRAEGIPADGSRSVDMHPHVRLRMASSDRTMQVRLCIALSRSYSLSERASEPSTTVLWSALK